MTPARPLCGVSQREQHRRRTNEQPRRHLVAGDRGADQRGPEQQPLSDGDHREDNTQ